MGSPAPPSPRSAWWLLPLVWAVAAALAGLHAAVEGDYRRLLGELGLRPGGETPLRQVVPARYADAQMWVRHALEQRETGVVRFRFTPVDAAPVGREVHWSSAFLWLLRGAGALQAAITGEPAERALERALGWFNLPLLALVLVGWSAWLSRGAGLAAGLVLAAGIVGHSRFYEGFAPANVDHHGLINAALLGLVLGGLRMGAGWWRAGPGAGWVGLPDSPESARKAAAVAGLSGGVALGLSAASTVPVIALLGLAGLVLARVGGAQARQDGAAFDPEAWRVWGRWGAWTALALYLFEYAPAQLGFRLEINHPLYAAAWWGGAELVALLAAGRGDAPAGRTPGWAWRGVLALLAVAAVPAAILLLGSRVFLVADPFVADLRHFVAEGRSLPAYVRQAGVQALGLDLAFALLLLPAWIALRRIRGADRLVLGWLTLATAALLVLSVLEVRWTRTASVAQLALAVLLVGLCRRDVRSGPPRWVTAGAVLLLLVPAGQRVLVGAAENRAGRVAAGDLQQPLYRDVAAALRASQPEGPITLLASPNASAGIAYFGRFRAVGTLFWENAAGLRAAAEILSADSDEEAFRRVAARGITHLVLLSSANFLGEYHRLLYPDADLVAARRTFGHRLLAGDPAPGWLQAIPYRAPPELREAAAGIRLFRVRPDQNPVDHLFFAAVAQVAAGNPARAERTLEAALGDVPAARRPDLLAAAGSAFRDYGADAAAARFWRRSLGLHYHAPVALAHAWTLATSRDASVRDGVAALSLAEPLARANPADASASSALAAAHAELGRFAPAVAAGERALAAADAAGETASLPLLRARLEAYRAGRPWRE